MNTFGRNFRCTTFGESHGKAVGVVIDGCPPGISLMGLISSPTSTGGGRGRVRSSRRGRSRTGSRSSRGRLKE